MVEIHHKETMPNYNPNQVGLKHFHADDTTERTITVTGKVERSLAEWLKTLPGGTSKHIRQAIKLYKQHLESKT